MSDFEKSSHFVRSYLANATDAQLVAAGVNLKGRDGFLSRPLHLSTHDGDHSGRFRPYQSWKNKVSDITYKPAMTFEDNLEFSAHEAYHAMEFWGNSLNQRFKIGALCATQPSFLVPILLPENLKQLSGIIIPAPIITFAVFNHNEETNAFGFGALFNPDTYKPLLETTPAVIKPTSLFNRFTENTLLGDAIEKIHGYPTPKKQQAIKKDARQKCVGGSILFPADNTPDQAFGKWELAGCPTL